jgi:Hypothetical glycosyl hydrolase family 15
MKKNKIRDVLGIGSILSVCLLAGVADAANANTYMTFLPKHLAHLETNFWDHVQRGASIRYPKSPAFPQEAVDRVGGNCKFIMCQSDCSTTTREQFTKAYPKRIYRFAYKNLTRHYDGLDATFTNCPQWFLYSDANKTPVLAEEDKYPMYNLKSTYINRNGQTLQDWWLSEMWQLASQEVPGDAIFVDALAGTLRLGSQGGYDYWGNAIPVPNNYYDNDYTENHLKPLLARIRNELANSKIIIGNFIKPDFRPDANYTYVENYAHCSYMENFESFNDSYTEDLNIGILAYQAASQAGKMTYFNMQTNRPTPAPTLTIEQMRSKARAAMSSFYDSLSVEEQNDLASMYAYFDFKLALFLLGANEYSYLSYQMTNLGNVAGKNFFRIVPPFPEFQKQLGKPLSLALETNNVWTRVFKHATVTLNSETGKAKITWGQTNAATIAVMTSPVNNSTLKNSTVTFNWTATAGIYRIDVGSSVGKSDLRSDIVFDNSKTYSFPLNGQPIYVRLSTYLNGKWTSKDYTYYR